MMQRRRKKLGEILIAQGMITNEQLVEALQVHKRTGVSLGTVLVNLGYISEEDLTGTLGVQIQLDQRKRLGEILIDQGLITQDQLQQGLEEQKKAGQLIGKCLVGLKFISEDKLVDALSAQLDIQRVVLENFNFDRDLVTRIPEDMARRYKAITLFERDGILTVALADPSNLRTIDHFKFKTGKEIDPVIATEKSIMAAIEKNYSTSVQQMSELLGSVHIDELDLVKHEEEEEESGGLTDEEGKQIVKLVNLIITQAVNENASDIHIEPMDAYVRLRYRIDGELEEKNPIPLPLRAQITSRLKIMAGMDIAEKRKPQDGHIEIRHQGRNIDFRVSTFPVMTRTRGVNEKMVLRIIDQQAHQLTLDQLGFLPGMLKQFDDLVRGSDGIILVTGPTGSGKSSTLYASLARVTQFYENRKNIVTMEDPVEFVLDGVNQGQINVKAGFNFDDGMRSDSATGPGHRDGGRNARQADVRDGDPGRAHRPHGVFHAPHQRLRERVHPSSRHGHRAVPHLFHRARSARAASREEDLFKMQGDVQRGSRSAGKARPQARHHSLQRERLPGLQQQRIQGPHRHLRAPCPRFDGQEDDHRAQDVRRHQGLRRRKGRFRHATEGRPAQVRRRRHHIGTGAGSVLE